MDSKNYYGLSHSIAWEDLRGNKIISLVESSLLIDEERKSAAVTEQELHRLIVAFQEDGLFDLVRSIHRYKTTVSAYLRAISRQEKAENDFKCCKRSLVADKRKRDHLLPQMKKESLVFELVLFNDPTLQDELSCNHGMAKECLQRRVECVKARSSVVVLRGLRSLAADTLRTELAFVQKKYIGVGVPSRMDSLQSRYRRQFFSELGFVFFRIQRKTDMLRESGFREILDEQRLQRDRRLPSSYDGMLQEQSLKDFTMKAANILDEIRPFSP